MGAVRGTHPAGHCCAMLISAPGADAMPAIHGCHLTGRTAYVKRCSRSIGACSLAALTLFVTDFGQDQRKVVVQTINTCKRVELTA